jgi:hypothetical protein
MLEAGITATKIFDKLASAAPADIPKRAEAPGIDYLPVAGFRVRIKGRPRGEEMAVKHDFLHGSCPKKKKSALIDYGKHDMILRSGAVGVKAWVHFQRPHIEDETGLIDKFTRKDGPANKGGKKSNFPSLLLPDRDYNPNEQYRLPINEASGLWNVESAKSPLVSGLVDTLKELHTPDNSENSRFIW